jgi:hypothetical protein
VARRWFSRNSWSRWNFLSDGDITGFRCSLVFFCKNGGLGRSSE